MYGVIKNAKSIENWMTVVWFRFENLSQSWQAKNAMFIGTCKFSL